MTKHHRILLQPAYVLHRRAYRDHSLLLDVFTPGYGRLSLVARGARNPKSKFYGVLQPFRLVVLSWSGRGELATLTAAELNEAAQWYVGDALIHALYLNELLLRLLHRYDAHPVLFDAYRVALRALSPEADSAKSSAETERTLRLFEKCLLNEIGYGLVLAHETASGAAIVPDQLYTYFLGEGPVAASVYTPSTTRSLPIHGGTLLALAQETLTEPLHLKEAKQLMRKVLAVHLGAKPLASRGLVQKDIRHAREETSGQPV